MNHINKNVNFHNFRKYGILVNLLEVSFSLNQKTFQGRKNKTLVNVCCVLKCVVRGFIQ